MKTKNRRRSLVWAASLLALAALACQFDEYARNGFVTSTPPPTMTATPVPTRTPAPTATSLPGETVRQWAVSAIASSEHGNTDWSASQATGAPNTLSCGDRRSAWASLDKTSADWLELRYEKAVYPQAVYIHHSYAPDAVVKVELIDLAGGYHPVYSGKPSVKECPYRMFLIVQADYLVIGVRITLDQSALEASLWDEIDAVELVGLYSETSMP
ncbi:MAG: hypothetical protein AB1846_11965 [Chloroflexota bacterium]